MADISNDKLFEVLLAIKGDVGEIRASVDGHREDIRNERMRVAAVEMAHNERAERHESRICNLENRQHAYAGGAGVFGAIFGALASYLTGHVK